MAAFSRLQLAAALIEYDNDIEDPDIIRRSANDSAIFSHLRKRNLNPRTKAVSGLGLKSNTELLQVPLPDEARQDTQTSRKSRASISTLQNPFRGDLLDEDEPEEEKVEEPEVDLSSWGLDAILPRRPKEKHARRSSHAKTIDIATQSTSERRVTEDVAKPFARRYATTDEFGAMQSLPTESVTGRHSMSWNQTKAAPQSIPFPQATDTTEDGSFAPPLPPMNRASRFDPKVQAHARTVSVLSRGSELLDPGSDVRPRTVSGGTLATLGSQVPRLAADSMSQTHRGKFTIDGGRGRTVSSASFGSQQLLGPGEDESIDPGFHEDPQYTRAGLLRPKVLVMPSPLQTRETSSTPPDTQRDGFQLSQNGSPFPAGAVTTARDGVRPLSSMLASSSLPGSSSNPFTANPRQSLTLSQLTFRNSLMVGGQRDVSYNDIEGQLSRAQEEGEQISKEEEEEIIEQPEEFRPAGKLFGKSLIDDLEARKSEIRSKQRTFMGDQRVSMMARSQPTLVDLNEPSLKPSNSLHAGNAHLNPRRRTLIDLDDNGPGSQGRFTKSASVFGVDTVWERELQKLKEIEEREAALIAEETQRKEATRAAEQSKRAKKGKGKGRKLVAAPNTEISKVAHIPEGPPILPAFELRPTVRRVQEPESDAESDDNDEEPSKPSQLPRTTTWYAGDSDEETPATWHAEIPREDKEHIPVEVKVNPSPGEEGDDDDDVPLNQVSRGLLSKARHNDSDEEEDKPLSVVLEKIKVPGSMARRPPSQKPDDDDDDEVPLALRRLTTMGSFQSMPLEDDDDRPLGLKMQGSWPPRQVPPQFTGFVPISMAMGPPSIMGMPTMPFMQPHAMPSTLFNPIPPDPMANTFGKVDAWRRTVE